MKDQIYRQEAIEALEREKVYATAFQDVYTKTHPFEKYNMGLADGIKALEALPSAQPEIIRCKDCKYYTHPWYCEAWNNSPGFPAVSDEMFCSMAERRTDERSNQ